MSTVIDTSVIIDILRGLPAAVGYAEGLEDVPACSEITRIEVMRGLRSPERVPAERLFQQLHWVPLDEPIARRAGELGRKWRKSHPGISSPDLVVAATAETLKAHLATGNIRHFPMFKRLQPPYQG
ncbi:MAG: type II toxin-antitoxin system VapC family toxin [Actinobacteria bacterium]|nr:type II toxin-antitoxin system VapC family toxin [Actinomycetota bacterium]MDQ3530849.1 type II toxin-antitoxin system VapC family toxin [Actinomycetota bacterium]